MGLCAPPVGANAGRRASRSQQQAIFGFAILREEATPAIPVLTNLLSHYERRNTSVRALMSLSYIGTNGLMIVVGVITNASCPDQLRSSALSCINAMGTDAAPAVAVLVDALNDPKMGQLVPMKLGRLKLRPEVVVPALIKYLRTGDAPLAGLAADVLAEFGQAASNAVPDLLIATTNANAFLRRQRRMRCRPLRQRC